MPLPLSVDLRERVVAAVAGGASFHWAAARFGVSVSSASRWSQRFAQQGHVAPNRHTATTACRRSRRMRI